MPNLPAWLDPPHGWLLSTARIVLEPLALDDERRSHILRDDLLHPFAGGNKLRKLDALLPFLLATHQPDCVLTLGGIQSAHCAAVACLAAERGVPTEVLLRGERPEVLTGNLLITSMFARQITWVDRTRYANRAAVLEDAMERVGQRGEVCAVVPEGAATLPHALHGPARQVMGLAHTLPEPLFPWTLVIDAGTGTSAAGLVLGILAMGLPWQVEVVALMRGESGALPELVRALLAPFEQALGGLPETLPMRAHERVRARRFGKVYEDEPARCARIAQRTGVLFDPIYTLAAYEHLNTLEHPERAVLIHTGGALNLFGVAQRHPSWMPSGFVQRGKKSRGRE